MRLRTCLCFVLLATGCTDSDEDPVTDAAVAGEDTVVPLTPFGEAGFPVAVADDGTFSLGPLTGWAGGDKAYAAPLAGRVASEEVGFIVGYYKFDEWGEPWVAAGVSGFDADTGALAVDGDMTAELEVLRDGTVALTVTAPPGSTRTSVAFECPEDERFLGFGAQTVAMEHRGARVPIWVSEQGINKGDHAEDEFPPPFEGRLYDSYYPVPFFVSPRGYGVMVENTERIVFELCSSESKAWRVEAWAPQIRLILFSGDEPLDVIERYTAHVGRPPMPPDWALLPWVAIKGGTVQAAAAGEDPGVRHLVRGLDRREHQPDHRQQPELSVGVGPGALPRSAWADQRAARHGPALHGLLQPVHRGAVHRVG